MKHLISVVNRIFFSVIVLLSITFLPTNLYAAKITVDGIVYDLNKGAKEATIIGSVPASLPSELIIPSKITNKEISYTVRGIKMFSFDNTSIISVKIPGTIKYLENRCFGYCNNLKKVEIENGVSSIHYDAFCGSKNVTEVIVDRDVTDYITHFFNLEKLTIGPHVKEVRNASLSSCKQLTDLYINCEEISDINPGGLRKPWFNYLSSLKRVKFGENVRKINAEAFAYASNIESMDFSKSSLDSIGNNAFEGCDFEFLDLSSTKLKVIPIQAFRVCNNMKLIILPNTLKMIYEEAFYGCSKLEYVYIPDSVTCIMNRAFKNCDNLQQISLPIGFSQLGEQVFKETKLKQCDIRVSNGKSTSIPLSSIKTSNISMEGSLTEFLEDISGVVFGVGAALKNALPQDVVDVITATPAPTQSGPTLQAARDALLIEYDWSKGRVHDTDDDFQDYRSIVFTQNGQPISVKCSWCHLNKNGKRLDRFAFMDKDYKYRWYETLDQSIYAAYMYYFFQTEVNEGRDQYYISKYFE